MSIPIIAPTGALASGAYIDYMIGYFNTAFDGLDTQLSAYVVDNTITDWDDKWDQIIDDIEVRVTTLESSISTIQSQILMLKNAVSAL